MFALFLEAAWKVLLAGLVLGAGLPVLFAAGVRLTAAGAGAVATTATAPRARGLSTALGAACFLLVALAVVLGITVVVATGFGKSVSFEHVFPTLVDKA